MRNDFSILLVLKDRPQYTKRFMNHLVANLFPFKVLIADGGKDTNIQRLFEENAWPSIDYEYVRYPYDATLDDFYEKMADAVSRIQTKFVSVMDNDDFILTEGIEKCVEILKDPRYSSARGRIDDMQGNNMYTKFPNSITGETVLDRVRDQTKHFHGNWHNVTRTEHVQACWSMLNITKPKNMRFTEQVTGYLNVIWGDGYRGDFPWLIHDNGERIETENGSLQNHFPDQTKWIKSDYWLNEFNKMTELIGAAISYKDNISIENAMKEFTEIYPDKLPDLELILNSRIAKAKSIGYNEERIKLLYEAVERFDV